MTTPYCPEGLQQVSPMINFPKLKYRNQQVNSPITKPEEASLSPTDLWANYSEASQSLESKLSPSIPSIPSISSVSVSQSPQTDLSSLSSRIQLQNEPPVSKVPPHSLKAKAASLFRFFNVKEPSKQAWLDYQESICKQQSSNNGRFTPIGLPMVSSARLPSTVPKVNSKWDGVPRSVKERVAQGKRNLQNGSSQTSASYVDVSSSRSSSGQNTRQPSVMSNSTALLSHNHLHFPGSVEKLSDNSGCKDLASRVQTLSLASTTSLPELSPSSTPEFSPRSMVFGTNHERMNNEDMQGLGMPYYSYPRPQTPSDSSPRTPSTGSSFSADQLPVDSRYAESSNSQLHLSLISKSSSSPPPPPPNISIRLDSVKSFNGLPTMKCSNPSSLECDPVITQLQDSPRSVVSEHHLPRDTPTEHKFRSTFRGHEEVSWKPPESWETGNPSEKNLAPISTKAKKCKKSFFR